VLVAGKLSPEARSEYGRKGVEVKRQKSREVDLEAAIGTLVSRAPELTQSQLNVLRLVLAPALQADESPLPQAS
jgi:hypothetical protein